MELILQYQTPAKKFSEALPIGNGSLGAMVYGDFPDFHYSLNADTLWSGRPGQKETVLVSDETRMLVRELLEKKDFVGAQEIVQEYMTGSQYNESYVGAGFLHLKFENSRKNSAFEKFRIRRELSLDEAIVRTGIEKEEGSIQIESFVSGPADLLVTRIAADHPVSLSIRAKSRLRFQICVRAQDGELELLGEAPSHVEPNYVEAADPVFYGGGMKFSILNKVKSDGCVKEKQDRIQISNATEVIVYTAIDTGFRGYDKPLEEKRDILTRKCREKIRKAVRDSFEKLREYHISQYRELFERVSLCINDSEGKSRLYELLFQYGRYLMISSSRMNSALSQPANLQGIWCEDVRSVWSSNFTVNINTEMNYWLTGPCALSECDGPLLNIICELSRSGRGTAKETFGCKGWTACHNVDIWRHTAPVKGEAKWTYWPMGGVWLTTHLYRHYLYTNDLRFLREQAYPVMKEAAEFCMERVYEQNGVWYTEPNTSPENTFLDEHGQVCCISRSVTMDHALMREVLSDTLLAGRLLEEKADFLKRIEETLSHLPEYQRGAHGQLLEWEEDYEETDVHHRHFAHLVGFHPFHQIDFETRRELLPAVKRVLERRTHGMALKIGWNEGWLVNFYARLRDGEGAKEHLDVFLKQCTYPNYLGLHPPLGESVGEREIFQIDGNFGITAGIAEMLLYAKPGYLCLLPALPEVWKKGCVKGLLAPGGHRISIWWKDCALQKAVLEGGKDEELTVEYGQDKKTVLVKRGVESYLFAMAGKE